MIDPIEFFTGGWAFERRIEDRFADQSGEANGIAIFEAQGEGLAWVEAGELRIAGQSFEVSRRMSITPEDDRWLVRFEDGRPFHYLDLSSGADTVDHLCVDDLYTGDLEFDQMGPVRRFRTRWWVKGAAKDQVVSTNYSAT